MDELKYAKDKIRELDEELRKEKKLTTSLQQKNMTLTDDLRSNRVPVTKRRALNEDIANETNALTHIVTEGEKTIYNGW